MRSPNAKLSWQPQHPLALWPAIYGAAKNYIASETSLMPLKKSLLSISLYISALRGKARFSITFWKTVFWPYIRKYQYIQENDFFQIILKKSCFVQKAVNINISRERTFFFHKACFSRTKDVFCDHLDKFCLNWSVKVELVAQLSLRGFFIKLILSISRSSEFSSFF